MFKFFFLKKRKLHTENYSNMTRLIDSNTFSVLQTMRNLLNKNLKIIVEMVYCWNVFDLEKKLKV